MCKPCREGYISGVLSLSVISESSIVFMVSVHLMLLPFKEDNTTASFSLCPIVYVLSIIMNLTMYVQVCLNIHLWYVQGV